MRRVLLLLTVLLHLPISAEGPDQLRMLNGDRIHGTLAGLERGRLLFTLSDGGNPLSIPARFAGFVSHKRTRPHPEFINLALHFVNGDRFFGELLGIEGDRVRLRAAWGSEVHAVLPMVSEIEILPPPSAIPVPSLGQASLWSVEASRPLLETPDGFRLESSGGLTRRFRAFPERFRLDLRVNSDRPWPMLQMQLFSRRAANPEPDSLSIQVHNNMLGVVHFRERGQEMLLRRSMDPVSGANLDLSLFGDLTTATFHLFLDGEKFVTWDIPDFQPGAKARGAVGFFIPQFGHEFVHLQIRPWSGTFPLDRPSASLPPGAHRVLFRNGDLAAFRTMKAEKESWTFTTTDGREISLPFGHVDRILFDTSDVPPPRKQRSDVQLALLPHGNRVTLALESLDGEELLGAQDLWHQPLRIPTGHVQRIRFNIHQTRRYDGDPLRLQPSLPSAQ